jgi:hypothetical protein
MNKKPSASPVNVTAIHDVLLWRLEYIRHVYVRIRPAFGFDMFLAA